MRHTLLILFVLLGFVTISQDATISKIERMSSAKKKVTAYNMATYEAWVNGEFQHALEYSERGLKIAKSENLKAIEAKLHNNRGVAFDFLNDYPSALKHYFAGLTIQEKVNDPETKASILGNIGLIYMNQELNDKALDYHERALKINRKINDLHGISASLNNIAIIYARQGKAREAVENYQSCIVIDKQLNDSSGLGDNYNNIAIAYMDLKEFDTALDYLDKSLEIRASMNNVYGLATTYSNFGEVYYRTEDYDKARSCFQKSIQFAQEVNDLECLQHVHFWLSKTEEKSGNVSAAFEHYKLSIAYEDSIDNYDIAQQQTELELNYKFNKEKELTRLKQAEKDRQYTIVLYSVSTGLLLILLFSILFYRKWRQTQAQREIIEEKNQIVQQKNDEILASITYAKRIQKAILPSPTAIDERYPNNFVIYLPKDLVSGDFYWMNETDDTHFLAVADCTGHGVPGALMSVVCHNALNRAMHEFGKTRSAQILDKTRELVIEELSKHEDSMTDGMDISLCAFDKQSNRLNWSGANNPIWIWRKSRKVLEEINADKQPIGNHHAPRPFTEYNLELYSGDRIYLFSDGYQDQFGGEKRKKLMRKGLRQLITNSVELPMDQQKDLLINAFHSWKGKNEQVDDVCMIGFEYIS